MTQERRNNRTKRRRTPQIPTVDIRGGIDNALTLEASLIPSRHDTHEATRETSAEILNRAVAGKFEEMTERDARYVSGERRCATLFGVFGVCAALAVAASVFLHYWPVGSFSCFALALAFFRQRSKSLQNAERYSDKANSWVSLHIAFESALHRLNHAELSKLTDRLMKAGYSHRNTNRRHGADGDALGGDETLFARLLGILPLSDKISGRQG